MAITIALIAYLDFESFVIRQLHPLLEQKGFKVESIFLKARGNNSPTEKEISLLIDYLKSINPALVCMGIRSRYFKILARITERIKENVNAPVMWGSIHTSLDPENCIKYADILCHGEAEEALIELATKIQKNEDYTNIKNLWVKKDGKVYKNPLRDLLDNLDALPFTDFTEKNKTYIENDTLVHNIDDIKNNRIEYRYTYPIMTSRGCLYRCTFCINSFLGAMYAGKGKFTRRRSVDHVLNELKLAKQKLPLLNGVTFGDDVFSFDHVWLKEFIEKYTKEINLPFFIMFYPTMVEENIVKILKETGMANVQMGIQSGSERIRKEEHHRYTSDEQIRNALKIFQKHKIKVSCDLILGDIFETKEDREKTVEFLLSLPKPFALTCFQMNYFPNYPYTNKAMEKGLITEADLINNMPEDEQSFGMQFDTNRNDELLFWESLYKLATLRYFPKGIVKFISKNEFLQKKPAYIIMLTKTGIKFRQANRVINYVSKNINNPRAIYSKVLQKLSWSNFQA